MTINIANDCISNSTDQKILGVIFVKHNLIKLCKKAGQKIHALARISNFTSLNQRKLIMNAFISSQFSYCPLIWMCHSRSLNAQINKIHECTLRIVYNDSNSSFEELLVKYGSIRILASEIYKAFKNLSSSLMTELFQLKGINRKGNSLTCGNIKKLPKSLKKFYDYLRNFQVEKSFFLKPVVKQEIIDIILAFNNKKSLGPNSIPIYILKISNNLFSDLLTEIYPSKQVYFLTYVNYLK